ncbi:MAG: glycosyltransferase family 2 protein [Ostreibacterium sp.]
MSKAKKPTISLVMMVKNEAKKLSISLSSVAHWVDEIIILDSGSSDNSESVAKQYGAKWFTNTDWPGFGKQRQLAQSYATGDWILALDADEEVSAELKKSILNITQYRPKNTVYGLRRIDYIWGHPIDNPKWLIPVKAHWRLFPASFSYNDNIVHESVDINHAETAILDGYLRHHTANNPQFWLKKRLDYAMTWGKQRHQMGKKTNIFSVIGHTLGAFFKQYLIDGRFLMGQYGFIYACLFTQYTFNKYAILYDMNRQPKRYTPDFQPHKSTYQNLPNLSLRSQPKQQRKATLSGVLIVKNEQKHLPSCLNSIYDLCDEIIVLDSGSTDATETIAKHFNAKWYINEDWQGFGKQRQIAQRYATGDYILMLDADEQLDEVLKTSIADLLTKPPNIHQVFALKRLNIFCGKMVHGNTGQKIVRLYNNQQFSYHDYKVHESLNHKNAEKVILTGYMKHFTNDNLYHFLVKNARYSSIWAQEQFSQDKKTNLISLSFKTLFTFLRKYLIQGNFLGGNYGFLLSASTAGYSFDKYLILWNYQKQAQQNQ